MKSLSPSLTALILDLDDTLWNANLAYEEALQEVGIQPNGDPFLSARSLVKSRLPEKHVAARNRFLYFKALLERADSFSPAALIDLVFRYEKALCRSIQRQWISLGRDSLMDFLHSRFKVVGLTNENTRTQITKLECVDPQGKWFRKILTSEELGSEKPDPITFTTAAATLGVPPSCCLVIGDNLETDIIPAQTLGFSTVWTTEFSTETKPKDGFLTVRRLDDLRDLFGAQRSQR